MCQLIATSSRLAFVSQSAYTGNTMQPKIPRTERVMTRYSRSELELIDAAAEALHMPRAAYLRHVSLTAATRAAMHRIGEQAQPRRKRA